MPETFCGAAMRVLVYIGLAVWIGVGIGIFMWNFILSAQMMNHRMPKQWPILGRRRFSFQTDEAGPRSK